MAKRKLFALPLDNSVELINERKPLIDVIVNATRVINGFYYNEPEPQELIYKQGKIYKVDYEKIDEIEKLRYYLHLKQSGLCIARRRFKESTDMRYRDKRKLTINDLEEQVAVIKKRIELLTK